MKHVDRGFLLRQWAQSARRSAPFRQRAMVVVAIAVCMFLLFMPRSTTEIQPEDPAYLRQVGLENVRQLKRRTEKQAPAVGAAPSHQNDGFSKRIFIGPYDFAFQPSTLCRSLRARGVDCVAADAEVHPFGDRVDFHFHDNCDAACWDRLWPTFDILHFHELTPYPDRSEIDPDFWQKYVDAGKCVILQTHGTLFRDAEMYQAINPFWSPVSDKDADAQPRATVQAKLEAARRLSAVVTGDYELATYSSVYTHVLPRMLNLSDFPFVGVSMDRARVPLVVHAPSNTAIKGTLFIRSAISALRAEGILVEYQEITKSSHAETQKLLKTADIVIDQLRIGWYGVLSVEAMALGKPVLVYVRPDLNQEMGPQPPLVTVTPQSILDTLRVFVSSLDVRLDYSRRARKYVEREHDAAQVADRALAMYREVCS